MKYIAPKLKGHKKSIWLELGGLYSVQYFDKSENITIQSLVTTNRGKAIKQAKKVKGFAYYLIDFYGIYK